jgi:Dolichyl-phosphate-mannose-protein mannosyltransferase/C-terminal four TMM region of protein-O-mannosyltransferase
LVGPSLREGSPRGRASAGTSGAVTSGAVTGIPAIVVLLALGLILRLFIAYVLFPGSGFPTDLGAFQAWGNDIAQHGPIGFYARAGFIDYPPVYMLLLGAVSFVSGGSLTADSVKLLPMLADAVLALVVWQMALDLGVTRRRALIVALIVLVNPVTWFNSAIWGQADAVGSIFLLLGLRELQKDHREVASALAVLAVLTKLQLGILGFVVAFVVLRRSLAPRTGEPQPERILTSLGAGLIAGALICLPFTGIDLPGAAQRLATGPGALTIAAGLVAGLGVFALGDRYLPIVASAQRLAAAAVLGAGTVVGFAAMTFEPIASHLIGSFSEYPDLTLNAYNPWALVSEGTDALDRNLQWWVLHDSPWTDPQTGASGQGFVVGPFPATVVVATLAVAAVLVAVALVARRSGRGVEEGAMEPEAEEALAASSSAAGPSSAGLAPAAASAGRESSGPDGGALDRWRRYLWAEFGGLWAAFLVVAVVIAGVVLAAMSGVIYAATLGDGLLIATLLGVSIWAAWHDDRQSLLVALAILAIAFFTVPTRAHERYLFPFFGLGAVLLAVSWRWSVVYVCLAAANAVNLLAVLVEYGGIPNGALAGTLNDWGHGIMTATWFDGIIWPVAACSVVVTLAMAWALLQLRPRAMAALNRELAWAELAPESTGWSQAFWPAGPRDTSRLPDLPELPEPLVPELPRVGPAAPAPASAAPASASAALTASEGSYAASGTYDSDEAGEEWFDEGEYDEESDQPLYVPAWIMRLWHRLGRPSTHPDRSASLDSEPRGRLDRLDVWVVVALVVLALSMRVYRLDEPMQMHFDEVYHARTATEFLQDWRYNIPHDIYEWTHPHLAKYAIAGGITLFSDDKITATGALDVTVKDVLVEPRTPTPPGNPNASPATADLNSRYGDRALVATGSDVRVYDLQSRALVYTYPIDGASAFSTVGPTGLVYVGTSSGHIWRIDTNSLDDVQNGVSQTVAPAVELSVDAGLTIAHVYADSPPYLLVSDATGNIVSIDLGQGSGTIVAHGLVPQAADFANLGTGPAVLIRTPTATSAASASAEAQALATALGLDDSVVQSAMDSASSPGVPQVLQLGPMSDTQVTAIESLVSDGSLPDIHVNSSDPQAMVAYKSGIGMLDAATLVITSTLATDAPATSIALNYADLQGTGIRGDQSSYVAAGASIVEVDIDQTTSPWTVTLHGNQTLKRMPGTITKVMFDRATRVAQALGKTPDGSGWTVYAIETNGNAVFDDATLPFQPAAIGLDSSPTLPDTDREEVLAFAPNGSMASVDVGQFAFSWRIVGVLFGVLMAACLYLLVRLLFRRRSVGLLVALFSLTDGMLFVQSRIAMNDTYVGGFLLLGYLLFAVMWLKVWQNRFVFWLGMPALGVILGLALVSKWVALYAIASIGILILIRSALGRLITVLGLAGGTGVLGWMAIGEMSTAPNTGNQAMVLICVMAGLAVIVGGFMWALSMRTTPDRVLIGVGTAIVAAAAFGAALLFSPETIQNGAPNYTFFIIMLTVTSIAAAANAFHPVAWTREEVGFAIGAPMVLGVLFLAAWVWANIVPPTFFLHDLLASFSSTFRNAGLAGLVGGPVIAGAFWFAGRLGFGPLAKPPAAGEPASYLDPPAPAPEGWLRLGSGLGLPAAWMALCLMILPLVVYVALYIPWSMPWQPQTDATGQLPAIACWQTDPATGTCDSAWPSGHTGQNLWQLTIQMYNYHNDLRASHPASSPWWAWPMDLKPVWFENANYAGDTGTMIYDGGNPALWWLAIFAMGFICWQAFKRRSLGLTLLAVAFFWQWLSWARIDRAAFQYHFYTALPFFLAALAYFLAELWHGPSRRTWLLARVAAAAALLFPAVLWLFKGPLCEIARVNASNNSFKDVICGSGTGDVVIEARILLIAVVLVLALVALALTLWRLERRQSAGLEDPYWIVQLLVPVGIAGALLWWIGQNGPRDVIFDEALPTDGIVLVLLPVLAILAFVALTARNPRRFVLGACCVGVVTFLALYPNLSALPLPNTIVSVYNGLLPTWFYGFEFSVNLQPGAGVSPISASSELLTVVALLVAGFVAWAVWERRIILGYRRAGRLSDGAGDGEDGGGEDGGNSIAENGGTAADGSAGGTAAGGSDGSTGASGDPAA